MSRNDGTRVESSLSASEGAGPLYKIVERKIRQCLADGEWKPGEMLPPEAQLAKRFGVAVFTVRAGVRNLVSSNVLTRRQGKGTFVTVHGSQPRFRFFNIYRNDGATVYPNRQLLDFKSETACDDVARMLRMRDDKPTAVFHFTLVLETDGIPIGFYDIFLSAARFAGLTETDIRATTGNMYGLYQARFGINIVRTEERVSAVKADARSHSLLGVPMGDPAMRIDRIAFSFNDEPIEYRRIIHESSQYHYLHKQGLD